MYRFLLILAAALTPAAFPQQQGGEPLGGSGCVPDGSTGKVNFPRPELDQPGIPVDARWAPGGGAPEAFEKDRFSSDDPMPTAPGSGDPAEVPVENAGGKLKDGNGKTQNGGREGACIEVYVEWTYYYAVKQSRGGTISLSGASWTHGECWYVWVAGKIRSKVKQVCPC